MDQKPIELTTWRPSGLQYLAALDILEITHHPDGSCVIQLVSADAKTSVGAVRFESPLATRVTDQGNLGDYWSSGIRITGYNLFVAEKSDFLDWLERSSSGVHRSREVKHYAIFTEDICVEILSRAVPLFAQR